MLPVAAFAANVSTSKATYVPGEKVTIHGQGWRAGEHVSLAVTPGGRDDDSSHRGWRRRIHQLAVHRGRGRGSARQMGRLNRDRV
jgi:hypothetical protein